VSELEQVDNAANPKKVREKGRKEDREERQRDDDLRELLASDVGRRFLRRLIFDVCHLNQTSIHPSGQQFAVNEGARGVGVKLQGEIMAADIEGWIRLLREHHVKPDV
jgi:hypothetical protein